MEHQQKAEKQLISPQKPGNSPETCKSYFEIQGVKHYTFEEIISSCRTGIIDLLHYRSFFYNINVK